MSSYVEQILIVQHLTSYYHSLSYYYLGDNYALNYFAYCFGGSKQMSPWSRALGYNLSFVFLTYACLHFGIIKSMLS